MCLGLLDELRSRAEKIELWNKLKYKWSRVLGESEQSEDRCERILLLLNGQAGVTCGAFNEPLNSELHLQPVSHPIGRAATVGTRGLGYTILM